MANSSGKFGGAVWSRKYVPGLKEMSTGAYANAVSAFTVFGLAVAILTGYNSMDWRPDTISLLLVGLGIPIIGIVIAFNSSNWIVSFIGYMVVVIPMGAVSGIAVSMYQTDAVITALTATGGVTVVMALIGALYRKSLEHWGGYLFAGLLSLLFVRLAQSLMMGFGVMESLWYIPLIEYGAAVLFSLYIIYDWNRAMHLQKTMDNAVDSTIAIFLDIVNLFLTLLRIVGGPKVKD